MVRLERHRETSGLPEARSNSVADPGQLEVVRRLGEGSFAVVDLCEFSGDGLLSLPSSRASDLQSANKSVLVAVKKMKTHVDPPPPNPYANANHAPPLEPVPQKWVENFKAEAALLRSLKHPNVVACYGSVAVAEPDLHIILEYCPGGNLREKIGRGDYDAQTGLQWLLDVAHGMSYLHDKAGAQLAHRDLKPENIMLSAEGRAKIGDFGLSKAELQPAKPGGSHNLPANSPPKQRTNRKSWSRATVTPTTISVVGAKGGSSTGNRTPTKADKGRGWGSGWGSRSSRTPEQRPSQSEFSLRLSSGGAAGGSTGARVKRPSIPALLNSGAWELAFKFNRVGPTYVKADMTGQTGSCLFMAPENFLKKPYTAKVDVFAFGIIAVEVLARRRAYEGLFLLPDQIAHAVAHKGLRPKVPPKWPPELQQLVKACWAEDPAERPTSVEIVRQLEHLMLRAKAEPTLLLPLERKPSGCLGACGAN